MKRSSNCHREKLFIYLKLLIMLFFLSQKNVSFFHGLHGVHVTVIVVINIEKAFNIDNIYHYIFSLVHIYANQKKNIVHVKHHRVLDHVFFHYGRNGVAVRNHVILEYKNVQDIIYLFDQIVAIFWKKYGIAILNVAPQVRRNSFREFYGKNIF
jgi:hypothetical protein